MTVANDRDMMKALLAGRRVRDNADGEERWLSEEGVIEGSNGLACYPEPADGWSLVPQRLERWAVVLVSQSGEYVVGGALHLTQEGAEKRRAKENATAVARVTFEIP